jgi:hypothetical protein
MPLQLLAADSVQRYEGFILQLTVLRPVTTAESIRKFPNSQEPETANQESVLECILGSQATVADRSGREISLAKALHPHSLGDSRIDETML